MSSDPEKAVAPVTRSTSHDSADVYEVDWDGPDDPENPMNWPYWRKVVIVIVVCAVRFVTSLANAMMAPAVLDIQHDLHTNNNQTATFVVSIYLIGFGIGPLFLAPLSELYGRNKIYNIGNVLFTVFTLGCALSPSMGVLLMFRALVGIVGGAPMTNGGGTVADIVPLERRGIIMAIFTSVTLISPIIGPIVGGVVSQSMGWRWIFWILTIISGVITVVSLLFLRETYGPVILEQKAQKLRKETKNELIRVRGKKVQPLGTLLGQAISRPLRMLFLSPVVLGLSLYMGLVYGYVYLLFTTLTVVFHDQYGFSETSSGFTYIGFGVGTIFACVLAGYLNDRLYLRLAKRHNEEKPEFRLPLLIYSSLALPIGLFLYGWTADEKLHWILPIIGTAIVGIGMTLCTVPIQSYLVDAFTAHAASALAANSLIRSLAGGLLPLAGLSLYDKLGLGWGNSLLGFIGLAFGGVPILFYRYGPWLRERFVFVA